MINIVQGLTLVGLGMLVESKEKRQKVFGLMNKLGKTAEKTVKEITKSMIISKMQFRLKINPVALIQL